MTLVSQFFSHRPIASKAKIPEQLIDPDHRQIRFRFSSIFSLQSGILFFHCLFQRRQFGESTASSGQDRLCFAGR